MSGHESLKRQVEGAAQGAATDAAPQPPAPNTNLVLSVPEPLPPIREGEVSEGWRGSCQESDKEAGQAVGKERDSELDKKRGDNDAKKGEGGDYVRSRAGVTRGESKGVVSPITTPRGVVTVRDVEVLRWVGRHGV